MKQTTVINIKHNKDYDEWIGNGSQWEIPKHLRNLPKDQLNPKYEEWVLTQSYLMEDIPLLKGMVLGCSCKPDICHGDVLAKLANGIEETTEKNSVYKKNGNWYISIDDRELNLNTEKAAKMLMWFMKNDKSS